MPLLLAPFLSPVLPENRNKKAPGKAYGKASSDAVNTGSVFDFGVNE